VADGGKQVIQPRNMSLDPGFERGKLAGRARGITGQVGGELRQPVLLGLRESGQRIYRGGCRSSGKA
ncbi:hypothetical protein, partial [Pseudomonas aeruginosa]